MKMWALPLCATLVAGISFAIAQSRNFELNTPYQCPAETTFKVLACAGAEPTDMCEVETHAPGRARYSGRSTRADIMALMPLCCVACVRIEPPGSHPTKTSPHNARYATPRPFS